jgi:hypothetical protein
MVESRVPREDDWGSPEVEDVQSLAAAIDAYGGGESLWGASHKVLRQVFLADGPPMPPLVIMYP